MMHYFLKINLVSDETISLNEYKITLAGSDIEITDAVMNDEDIDELLNDENVQQEREYGNVNQDLEYYKKSNGGNKSSNNHPAKRGKSKYYN